VYLISYTRLGTADRGRKDRHETAEKTMNFVYRLTYNTENNLVILSLKYAVDKRLLNTTKKPEAK
jgi:hypothetical protein